jgi:hypothetical protein
VLYCKRLKPYHADYHQQQQLALQQQAAFVPGLLVPFKLCDLSTSSFDVFSVCWVDYYAPDEVDEDIRH